MRIGRRAASAWAGLAALVCTAFAPSGAARAGNPIAPGWYADPEIRIFDGRYWIYPTTSAPSGAPGPAAVFSPAQAALRRGGTVRPSYLDQTYLDAFSSPDLVHWTRHPHVLDVRDVSWAAYAVWAPSAIEAGGKYHLFFAANDIQRDGALGGIGVAESDRPGGPFKDAIGAPLVGGFHNGDQPIDPFVFRDDDGSLYLYYGGWGRCNVVRLSADVKHVVPMASGETFKEITPPGYVEGSFVVKRRGVYYLMWSEGNWTTADYRVAYATGPSPVGPFKPGGVILQQDARVARGAGHHSVVNIPGTDDWYIVYHRRPLGDADGDHRELAIEHMSFAPDGSILPVKLTTEGVAPRPLP